MDIELLRGDTEVLTVTVTDAGNLAVSLTGASAWFTIKRRIADLDADAVLSKAVGSGITITNAAGGILTVTLTADDTAALLPGSYWYDVQVREAAGRVSTVSKGRARVRADVTRATV